MHEWKPGEQPLEDATTGCILLARYPGQLTNPGPRAILSSSQICAAFEARTHLVDRIELQIIGVRT